MMNKFLKKILVNSLVLILGFSVFSTSSIYAMEKAKYEDKLNMAIDEALKERNLNGEASDESIKNIESILSEANITVDNSDKARSGKWVGIDSNWRFRVDEPHTGGDTAKYHVHVEGKVGNKRIESSEGVDGTKSHKKTMSGSGVPGWVQKKIKNSKEYKKGKELQKKVKSAKAQMNSKKLNLRKTADIVIAIGIFVSVVGVAIFVISATSAWGSLLLLI